ncbi:hypothetical protein DH2020_025314 [Rehmannia glutinosa]|uniref:Uncharacterized protein n=1 Tax=Rehmannia glutinosa TaxID=99300 RepID=A0ABR0W2M8_REHGL
MGNELRYAFLVETRRLLLLIGVIFGLILFVQYFELPYSSILSSLFSTEKSQVDSFRDSTSRNLTYFSKLNSTDLNDANGTSSRINPFDEKNSDAKNVKDPENNNSLDDTLNNDIDPEDESPSKDFIEMDHNSTNERIVTNNSFPLDETTEKSGNTSKISDENKNRISNQETRSAAKSPSNLPSHFASPENPDKSSNTDVEASSPITSTGKDAENILQNNENPKILKAGDSEPLSDPSISSVPSVVPISKMNDMLLQSYVSYRRVKPRWSSTVDQELLNAKSLIQNASIIERDPQFDVSLYRNFSEFKRSYELMEQTLKVYIYAEGEKPIFHQPPLKGIYASEGCSRNLEVSLYAPDSHNRNNLIEALSNYEMISKNIISGIELMELTIFLLPVMIGHQQRQDKSWLIVLELYAILISKKDFNSVKTFLSLKHPSDLLRILLSNSEETLLPIDKSLLSFFAGRMHGSLRPVLLNYWENKDPDMKIFGKMRKAKGQMSYVQYMKSSKYCICAKDAKSSNSMKFKPNIGAGPSSSSRPKIDSSATKKKVIEGSIKNSAADAKNRSTINVSKMVKKTSTQSKTVMKTVTKTREKKVFSLPGQKFDVPEEVDGTWHVVTRESKKSVYKKQRKQKQLRTGTPIKSPPPSVSTKPESSKGHSPFPRMAN